MILLAIALKEELPAWPARADVDVLATGIGPVESACAIADALARRRYALVVNAGIAGAIGEGATIGDGVIVGEDSMELTLEGGVPLDLPADVRLVERARSDTALVAQLRAKGFSSLRGVTVTRVTATDATAQRLARERGAQIESMEGFAVLRAAERAGVRAIQLRGVSNRCGDRESSGWDFAAGTRGLREILDALLALPGLEKAGTKDEP